MSNQYFTSTKNFSAFGDSYNQLQQNLSSQIKQPQNLRDLKRNANLKYTQLGDLDLAANLAYEHQRIIQDINNYYKN